ncbi:ribosomal L15-domain-containing protein [Dipodascopsis uninucleata]
MTATASTVLPAETSTVGSQGTQVSQRQKRRTRHRDNRRRSNNCGNQNDSSDQNDFANNVSGFSHSSLVSSRSVHERGNRRYVLNETYTSDTRQIMFDSIDSVPASDNNEPTSENQDYQDSQNSGVSGNETSGRRRGVDGAKKKQQQQSETDRKSEATTENAQVRLSKKPSSSRSHRKQKRGNERRIPSSFGAKLTLGNLDGNNVKSSSSSKIELNLQSYFGGGEVTDSLAARILEEIHEDDYECMICMNSVHRKSKIWTCDTCYRIFHIKCIQKWANQVLAVSSQNESAQDTPRTLSWRCPGCQTVRSSIPERYTCWCGKVTNPDPNSILPPHSCGMICSHDYDDCPHACKLPCHPGPHQKCNEIGPTVDCYCGKSSSQKSCLDTEYEGWSCGVTCGELMACGVHTCPRPCHQGLCGPCKATIHSTCYCGKHDKDIKCHEALESRISNLNDVDGNIVSWIGLWNCSSKCDRYFDCGIHKCQKSCHSQDIEPAQCPKSPDLIVSCPCGKHAIEEINGKPRISCEEPVPTCNDICGKKLVCGHTCRLICHLGDCGPCMNQVTVQCLCKFNKIKLSCSDLLLGTPRCQRTCRIQLNCQRHECGAQCCLGEKAALDRISRKKKDNQNLDVIIEPQHICTRTCNNILKCGNHRCQMTCHRGQCMPCLEASFDELSCHCGKTKMMPPIPCGAKPPKCHYQCNRIPTCGHPAVNHNCHLDDEPCPKCPYLVERECMCGKHVMKNQQCGRTNVSCGTICNKPLACGSHRCKKPCHREGQCESPCRQPCDKPKSCGHPDEESCHSPFQCEESKPCSALVEIACPCGNMKTQVRCNATKTTKSPKRILKCNDKCALIARNNKLAEALKIDLDTKRESAIVHSDTTLRLYATNKKWCESIEKIIDSFVTDVPRRKMLAFPPMKRTQRQFIHSLAEAYSLESESLDPEPHRSVVLHRLQRTVLPDRNLAQSYTIFLKSRGHESSSSSVLPAQLKKTPKQAFNAFLLEHVQVGLTRADLEKKLDPVISGVSNLKFSVEWIADEDVILRPLSNTLAPDEVEYELSTLKPVIKKFAMNVTHLAEAVELCWLSKDNTISYRETPPVTNESSNTSAYALRNNTMTALSFKSFTALDSLEGTPDMNAPAKAEIVLQRAQPKSRPIANSWEELDPDEEEGMGAYKYLEELQRKKQSDILRFLLRVRCWEYRQLNVIHRASRPSRPDKARRLGYKAKQGFVIYRVRVRRGGRKRPVPKGATYGKPTNMGVTQLKYQRSLRTTAEERVGRRCPNLRVLNSYWINQDSTYKYFEVILVDPSHNAIRNSAKYNWIAKPVHKHRESRGLTSAGKQSRGIKKGHLYHNTQSGRRHTWKLHNTLSLWRYR